jgi:HK97 family phage major capsid protein
MPNVVLQRLVQEREQLLDDTDSILARAGEDERDPSEPEMALVRRNRARLDELDPQINELLELEETRDRGAKVRASLMTGGDRQPVPPPGETVQREGAVYATFAEYARDALITKFDRVAQMAGPELRQRAAERLERAVTNTLSSDVPGLITTQHIAQIFDVINKSRPLVSACRSVNLTSGKLDYPSITGRPSVGKQTAEKTETTSTKMTVAMNQVVADTFLGAGDLSWQTIQWGSPDALALWFDLAAEAYAQQTEAEACADLVAAATATAIAVGATKDLANWMKAISASAAAIRKRKAGRANGIAMDVDTGYTLLALVSEANPVFLSAGPGSIGDGSGSVAGLGFIISDQLPASTAIVGDYTKMLVAETAGAPVEMRAVEPSIGGLEVGVIGAFADAVAVPGAFQKITP